MSDTRKTRDATAREGRVPREGLGQAEEAAQHTVEELHGVGEAVAETVVRTADAAVEMGQRVAEQGQEVMLLGVRTAAGMNGRIADAGYVRGHRVLGAAARVLDICREAGDSTAENVQALFSAYMTLGRGAQQMQHACLELLDRAVDRAAHKPQDLLRCKTLEEVAEVQRDLYLDAVNHAIESSTTLLQLAAQTAQQAMRPLQARAGNGAVRG
jgi:Phasin protein